MSQIKPSEKTFIIIDLVLYPVWIITGLGLIWAFFSVGDWRPFHILTGVVGLMASSYGTYRLRKTIAKYQTTKASQSSPEINFKLTE